MRNQKKDAAELKQRYRRFFFLSIALHLIFFSIVVLSQLVFEGTPILSMPTVQVDVVALPDQMKNSLNEPLDLTKQVKENVAEKPPAKKDSEPDQLVFEQDNRQKKAENAAKLALERLRNQVKKEQEKKSKDLAEQRKEALKNFENKYRAPLKGNQLNQGFSATGALKATADAYGADIRNRVLPHWGLPAWLTNKDLRAVVRIYIGTSGQLLRYKFIKHSGNQVFDDYVREAITQASPFAPPPANMSSALRSGGIDVLFPL